MLKKQNTKPLFDESLTKDVQIAIVTTDYHEEFVSMLEKYAVRTLIRNGVEKTNIQSFTVPGSWEIPLLVKKIAESKKFDAIITLGVILKGDTLHFEMIANELGRALMQISLNYSMPIALEVLAVYKKEQAEARAGDNEHNKGIEGATAVLKMLQRLQIVKRRCLQNPPGGWEFTERGLK